MSRLGIFGLAAFAVVGACDLAPGRSYRPATVVADRPAARPTAMRGSADSAEPVPSVAPAPLEWRPREPSTVVHRRLPNGVPIIVVHDDRYPTGQILFIVHGAPTMQRAAAYTFALIAGDGGAERPEALRVAREEGARIWPQIWPDGIAVAIQGIDATLPTVAAGVADNFVEPALSRPIITRVRPRMLKDVTQSSGFLARKEMLRRIFPLPHPYGAIVDDDEVVTLESLEEYRDSFLAADHVTVLAFGHVDADALVSVLGPRFRRLPDHPRRGVAPVLPPLGTCTGGIETTTKAGRALAGIAMGYPTTRGPHADVPALEVLAMAASSRLNDRLRKDLGATNEARVMASTFRHAGTFTIELNVEPRRVDEVIAVASEVVSGLKTTPVSADELFGAKARARFDAHERDFADIYGAVATDVSVEDALARRKVVDSLGPDALTAAAVRYLDPTRRCAVVVRPPL